MKNKSRRGRIEIIDEAKCVAIVMVILGHTATNDVLLGNPPILYKVLYSIHMPLFFFLSGLSIPPMELKTREEWKLFFRKTMLTLAIPYLIWALIYCSFSFKNLGWILYGSWYALGKTGTVTSLWYLSCFFLARIFVQMIISMVSKTGQGQKRLAYLLPAVVCMVLGVLLPDFEIGFPWCFNIAFVAAGCILLAIATKDRIIHLSVQKGWILMVLLCVSIGIYTLLVIHRGNAFGIMMMCRGSYGNPVFALIFAVLGGFAVLVLSMILKRLADEWLPDLTLKPLIYLGQHTMGVFLLHKPLLQMIFMPTFENLFPEMPHILICLLATIAALSVSLWLCRLIEFYIPELVGIFSKDIIAGKRPS